MNANQFGSTSGDVPAIGLVRLANLFPAATRTSTDEVAFSSCATDWREVEPGDVFVALPDIGDGNDDGHIHAQRAVSHGAIAVVCEQPVPVFDVPTYLVPDTRVALGEISQALMGHPSQTLEVIGVTGTHGKSTTVALLEAIFTAAGKHCGKLSSLGCYDGMTHSTGISDSPTAPFLASRLARMEAAGCTHAIVEISSQVLSQSRLAGMQLGTVCVTNVTEAQLDRYNNAQTYRDTQRRVLTHLAPSGVTVLNADDPVSVKWLDRIDGPVLTHGRGEQAEVTATVIESHANEQTFVLSAGSDSAAVQTKIVGEHHVSNCLAAATVALAHGIDLQHIARGLESVEQLPSRMELVDCGQGFPVFVDAANSANALRASLRTARQLADRRVICVWGETLSAAGSEHLAISHVLSRMADLAIVAQPLASLDTASEDQATVEVVTDRSEAIACAVAMAEPGDVVVITGSRVDPGLNFGCADDASTDSEIARELLYAREAPALRLVA